MLNSAVRVLLPKRPYFQRWVPVCVLIVGCALTAIVVLNVAARDRADAQSAFESDVLEARRGVQEHFDTVVALARAASALLGASPEINYTEFRAFVAGLHLEEGDPTSDGIGFAPRVRQLRLAAFTRDAALDGIENLRVRPAEPRVEYFPTMLLEPSNKANRSLIGFDLATDPNQRMAIERARDSGLPAITEPVTIDPFSAEDGRPRTLLYLAVYRPGAKLTTVDERRRAFLGYVFMPFQADTLLRRSLSVSGRWLAIEVFDTTLSSERLLYSAATGQQPPRFSATLPINIGGREWLLDARSRTAAAPVLPRAARPILAAGVLLSLLLFALMRAQVRARETSDRHRAELLAADRAKDEFLATLSHELRTPLNAVLGWLAMMRSGAVREERHDHALDVIERNARAQAQLIEDLLDLSRILLGRIRLDKRALVLLPAVGAVLDSLRPAAQQKGVRLHAPLLLPDRPLLIAADETRFNQIVTNLVWNAVKFTPAGGEVWVDVKTRENHVEVSIRDTGIGITPDFLPHVFDRFRQADSSPTRTHNGIGMGLAIVRDLVHLHDGRIDAYSEGQGRGAIFVLKFPLLAMEQAA
jgi:signal transduction histidine kinase